MIVLCHQDYPWDILHLSLHCLLLGCSGRFLGPLPALGVSRLRWRVFMGLVGLVLTPITLRLLGSLGGFRTLGTRSLALILVLLLLFVLFVLAVLVLWAPCAFQLQVFVELPVGGAKGSNIHDQYIYIYIYIKLRSTW